MAVGCFVLSFRRSGKLPVAETPEQGHGGARDRADQAEECQGKEGAYGHERQSLMAGV